MKSTQLTKKTKTDVRKIETEKWLEKTVKSELKNLIQVTSGK